MRGARSGLIHIEYGFGPSGTLNYLQIWSSISRGHWLLAWFELRQLSPQFLDPTLKYSPGCPYLRIFANTSLQSATLRSVVSARGRPSEDRPRNDRPALGNVFALEHTFATR